MFRNHLMQRITAGVVLTTFVSLSMYPLTAAAQAKAAVEKAGLLPKQKDEGIVGNAKRYINKLGGSKGASAAPTADERFAQLLNDIHEDLKAAVPHTALSKDAHKYAGGKSSNGDQSQAATATKDGKQTRAIGPTMRIETDHTATIKPLPGTDIAAKVKSIKSKAAEVKGLYAEIDQSFKETEQHLKNAKLPQEILERHNQAVFQYESRKAEFGRLIGKIEQAPANSADQQSALADLGSFMAKFPNAKPHQYTDPNKLPFGTNNGKVREPHLTKEQYQASLFPPKYNKVMLAGSIPDGLKLAQATLPQTPSAPDTAETDDVQITQAIRDKAAELNNNPVQIYNWVRNNIQFIPSYGSIQGSDMTLMSKRGNAFDTASLLIALYRAAGIPARYVYGTIEVPADKVMNWVGGVTKPQAAQSLLGQGGIPSVGLVSGGAINAIRMEHVWVEAYVDYTPSRGAINKAPNTWVPMDASFKQYQFTSGMDIKNSVPFDAQSFLDKIKEGTTADELVGSVRGIDAQKVDTAISQYKAVAKAYVDNRVPNASLLDVVSGQEIIQKTTPVLLGTLPYSVRVIGEKFQNLPDRLRHFAEIKLYADNISRSYDSPDFSYRVSMPVLAGKRFTLSYDPASEADKTALMSYLDANGRTSAQWITAYLVRVKPVLRLDGSVVRQGSPVSLGQDEFWDITLSSPNLNPNTASNTITAGSYTAVVPHYSAISPEQLKRVKDNASATQVKLDARSPDLTKDDFTGALLYSAGLGYWALTDLSNRIAAKAQNAISYRLQTLGLFSQGTKVLYRFGIPYSITMGGVNTDIDFNLRSVVSNESQNNVVRNYMLSIGIAESYLEGTHWELVLKLPKTGGISASRLIEVAARNGMDILSISSANASLAIPKLTVSQDVKQEIANSVAGGNVVIVPKATLDVEGWRGSGYIILDEQTGSAAYKINGGLNGGEKNCQCYSFNPAEEFIYGVLITAIGLAFPLFGVILALLLAAISTYLSLCAIDSATGLTQSQQELLKAAIYTFGAISAVLAIAGLFATGATIGVLLAISMILIIASNIITGMLIDLFTMTNQRQ